MSVEPKKWGVIYNPKAGTRKVKKRWKAAQQCHGCLWLHGLQAGPDPDAEYRRCGGRVSGGVPPAVEAGGQCHKARAGRSPDQEKPGTENS